MLVKYPNLELLEYKAREVLNKDEEFKKTLSEIKESNGWYRVSLDFDVIAFPQWWGSTCTGFDVAEDGSPVISGCAMTKEYTTVVHETLTDTYVVFFGDRVCYLINNATARFYEDLGKRNLAGLKEALEVY